jgi:hypothetical protein
VRKRIKRFGSRKNAKTQKRKNAKTQRQQRKAKEFKKESNFFEAFNADFISKIKSIIGFYWYISIKCSHAYLRIFLHRVQHHI